MLATQRLLFGLKRLLLKPELSLPVVLSLGCTLAAVLTVLTIFHALIIRPLPHISNPEQLSLHNLQLQMGPVQVNAFTRPIFAHFRQYMQSYGDWAYLEVSNQQPVEVAQQQHQLTHMQASAGSAEILGLRLLRGDSAQQADGTDSVWISETTWHQLYQGDLAIVGKALNYQGKAYKIAGVYQDLLAFPTTSPLQNLQFWQFLDETQLRSATQQPTLLAQLPSWSCGVTSGRTVPRSTLGWSRPKQTSPCCRAQGLAVSKPRNEIIALRCSATAWSLFGYCWLSPWRYC